MRKLRITCLFSIILIVKALEYLLEVGVALLYPCFYLKLSAKHFSWFSLSDRTNTSFTIIHSTKKLIQQNLACSFPHAPLTHSSFCIQDTWLENLCNVWVWVDVWLRNQSTSWLIDRIRGNDRGERILCRVPFCRRRPETNR